MTRFLLGVTLVICSLAGLPLANRAQAANEDEARVYLDKATAAYALNRYAIAAENFEKAFELKPDPALLYNAAQAYRLAGNKERALELYESYLRVYGGKTDKRVQIESRIRELKQAIDHDKQVATSPPVTTIPLAGTSATPPPEPPPPAPARIVTPIAPPPATPGAVPAAPAPAPTGSNTVVLTQTSEPSKDDSLTKKPLFWVAVGGGVVVAAVVIVLLLSGGSSAATPSIGRARGN